MTDETRTISTPEPMLRFACNQKGCCCQGWAISFEVADALRITAAFPDDQREAILDGAKVIRDRDRKVTHLDLRRVGERAACQFLAADSACVLHRDHGVEMLPRLCRTFPAFAFQRPGGAVEVHWDAVCPEVLEQLDEGDAPFDIVTAAPPPGGELAFRGERPYPRPEMKLGGVSIDGAQLDGLRRAVVAQLGDDRSTAIEHLGRLSVAVAEAIEAGRATITLPDVRRPAGFDAFVDLCVEAHAPHALARQVRLYERFIHAISLEGADWERLVSAMVYRPDWRERVQPERPDLQPLLRRYLAHRFWGAFDRAPVAGSLSFAWASIPHAFGTAFRVADGLSRWLDRPVDRDVMKVALGTAEHLFRRLVLPVEVMPWFGLETPGPAPAPADQD